ncbi:MAG TPA: molybdenum cofactor guanylyltransferase [Candidatus Limnocylindrales bacterium]|nr:molybdenum cofactor guanylyltransferase [Candidatus Limnocylindrales bacterium]
MSVVGVVLAGGASTRFGSDKLAALIDGRPLLHHALEAVAAASDRVVLVLAPDAPAPPLPPGLAVPVTVARDDDRHQGPLAGLVAGLRELAADDVALVVAGDMPTLHPGVLRLLGEALAGDAATDAVCLEAEPSAPLPMAVRASAGLPAATRVLAEDRRSLRALLGALASGVVPVDRWRALDPDGASLRDIDRPEDR